MTQSAEHQLSPLDAAAVLDEVRGQTSRELGIAVEEIEPDTVLKQLPGSDSVRLLRVVAQIERIYDVELEDEDIFSVRTARDLTDLILAQRQDVA